MIPLLYMICSDPADLLIQIVVYFLLAISLEYRPHYKIKLTSRIWLRILHYVKYDTSQSYFEPLLGSYVDSSMLITDEDVDVTAERHRILSGLGDNAIIILRNLKKVLVNMKQIITLQFVLLKESYLRGSSCILHFKTRYKLKSCVNVEFDATSEVADASMFLDELSGLPYRKKTYYKGCSSFFDVFCS